MRRLVIFMICFLAASFNAGYTAQTKTGLPANEILQKVSEKLDNAAAISYTYYRNIHYPSENYRSEISGTTFLDFKTPDTASFKWQLGNDLFKMVYNGSESFYLDHRNKTIEINYQPKSADFASVSFFANSIVTLKNALPTIIAEKEIAKAVTDTAIGKKRYHLVSFVLRNKTLDGLGSFTPITLKRDFLYKIIIDKETFLPLQVIQTNNAEPGDYVLTSFSNITLDGENPPELSWYYSTYRNTHTPVAEKKASLIGKNTPAPGWELPYLSTSGRLKLDHLKGKVVLLEFWIKNCGYCINAIPGLNALQEKYAHQNFEIIGINAHDVKEDIAWFYQKNKPAFKTVRDNGKVTADYGVDAFPTVVVIDKKGIVIYSGSYDTDLLDKVLNDALK